MQLIAPISIKFNGKRAKRKKKKKANRKSDYCRVKMIEFQEEQQMPGSLFEREVNSLSDQEKKSRRPKYYGQIEVAGCPCKWLTNLVRRFRLLKTVVFVEIRKTPLH